MINWNNTARDGYPSEGARVLVYNNGQVMEALYERHQGQWAWWIAEVRSGSRSDTWHLVHHPQSAVRHWSEMNSPA